MIREERTDVVVVGAGLAGLMAATLVARAGRSVVVLEKAGRPGGRAGTQIRDGVVFNQGPHALYRAGHAARLLNELNVAVSGHLPKPGRARLVEADQVFRMPTDPGTLLLSRLLTAREKFRLVRFLSGIKGTDARSLDRIPLREWLESRLGRGRLTTLMRTIFRVTTYADDHDRLSAGAAIDQLRTSLAGNVLYLDGGWQSLVDGLRERAQEEGARLRTAARAVAVRPEQDGYSVRLAGGESVSARAVILAVEPGSALELLDLPLDGPLARWHAARRPIHAACLDLALSRLPRPSDRFALGLDRPYYYSVHSAAARLAPGGIAVVHVMKYLGGPSTVAVESIEQELESFLDRLQPGWRTHVVDRRFLPHLTVTHALPEAASAGLAGRPDVASAGRPGIFLAGDWVGAEGMLADASAASADRAAALVLAHLGSGRPVPVGRPSHVAC